MKEYGKHREAANTVVLIMFTLAQVKDLSEDMMCETMKEEDVVKL